LGCTTRLTHIALRKESARGAPRSSKCSVKRRNTPMVKNKSDTC